MAKQIKQTKTSPANEILPENQKASEFLTEFYSKENRKMETGSFKEFNDEQKDCFESWQTVRTYYRQDYAVEYELDKEDYLQHYDSVDFPMDAPFSDADLIKRLVKNLENARHPYLVGYRDYLKKVANSKEEALQSKDKLSTNQQILLLTQLDFFELPKIKNLPAIKIGWLLSNLLNRTPKTCTEGYRQRNGQHGSVVTTPKNKAKIEELLKDVTQK